MRQCHSTQTHQRTYIRQHASAPDLFIAGQENESAQRAQHAILIDFAKRGSGETIKAIYSTLEEEQRQTEPLLLTREGVVVNGNRRLAAMRELFSADPCRYSSFRLIQALILPPGILANDLRRIEVRLQMRPETRLPYDWADEALAIKDLEHSGITALEIKSLMQLEKESDVRTILGRLAEAEIYLEEFLREPNSYELVIDQEQQFIELEKAIRNKASEQEKELARRMCHILTMHSRDLGSRAYDFKIAYGTKTKEVATRLARQLNVPLGSLDTRDTSAEDDLFSDDIGNPEVDFTRLNEVLRDRDASQKYAETICDICVDIREEAREQNVGRKALKAVQRVERTLGDINFDRTDPETFGPIIGCLESIIEQAKTLLASLVEPKE